MARPKRHRARASGGVRATARRPVSGGSRRTPAATGRRPGPHTAAEARPAGGPTNKEIAAILFEIGDILELKDESLFRIMAYRNAARSVEFLSDDIRALHRAGGLKALQKIPGVGSSIALKIEELITTGRLRYHEQLRRSVPAVTLELKRIPGVGPKTAQKIYRTLKVKSTDELVQVLDTPRAARHFQARTRARIKKGVLLLKRLSGRMLLPFAEPIARELVEALRGTRGVLRADPVGSLRRMRETMGDIDIVCAAREPEAAIETFVTHASVREVLARGDTKATIVHAGGIQVDLEILPAEHYGSLTQHLTGSREHNIALRTWAVEHGFSMSEHGITKGGRLYTFGREEDVYEFMGLSWIPPELRENRGEIEAALQHDLPRLVTLEDIRGDLQGHSKWSDGRDQIEAIVKTAIARGYEYLAITDHTQGLGIARGLDAGRVAERAREMARIKRSYAGKIHVLEGLEVDIRGDGRLDLPDEILARMDLVVASIHSAFDQDKARMTARLVGAIRNPRIDIIGHPSGRLLGERDEYPVNWDEVFGAAAQTGVALEINAFPNRLDLRDSFAREARRQGAWIVIDTDYHRLEHLEMMRYGVAVARRAWLTKPDVLNTRPWEEFRRWLERER